jgi:hypothetical protein
MQDIFFAFPDERQKSVIPLRGSELTLRRQFHRGLFKHRKPGPQGQDSLLFNRSRGLFRGVKLRGARKPGKKGQFKTASNETVEGFAKKITLQFKTSRRPRVQAR